MPTKTIEPGTWIVNISPVSCKLTRVTVLKSGTGVSFSGVQFEDRASVDDAQGPLLAIVPSGAQEGQIFEFGKSAKKGLSVQCVTDGPTLEVSYE
jgi:hypothetical protein